MTKGQDHYLQNILEDAWVRVFASTNTAMMTYPYLLGHPDESSPTLSDMCETYIMDSKIGDSSVTNEDVIRRSKYLDADVVTPADVMHDPETTTERVVDLFSRLADEENYDPEVLIPLQPNHDCGNNHVDHYYSLRDELRDHGINVKDHRLSVGGIKEWSGTKQLDAVIGVRKAAGEDQFLHALGLGTSHDWISVLRQYPWLLDSLDMTSVMQDVVNAGKLLTPSGNRVDYRTPRGTNSTVLMTMLREYVLYMMSYVLGPHPNPEDVPTEIVDEDVKAILSKHGLSSENGDEMTKAETTEA